MFSTHSKNTQSQLSPSSKNELSGLCVLLAEDNIVNQNMVSIILKKRGAHVIVADNGQEALEKFSSETIDIILMDIQMPVLDGYQATQKIRKLENKTSTHIPIIALTANALNNEKERCFALGMDGYLSKPFSIQDLLECIKNTLNSVAIKHKKA